MAMGPSRAGSWTPRDLQVALPRGNWRTLVLVVWSAVIVVAGSRLYVKPTTHSVYPEYAATGRAWLDPETNPPSLVTRQYGPSFGVLLEPFASLPDHLGGPLWAWLGIGFFLAGFVALRSTLDHTVRTDRLVALFWLLMPICGVASLFNAQANILLAGCFMLGASAFARRQWWLAATCLAIPIVFKSYPIAVAGVFSLMALSRLPWRGVVVLVALLSMPLLFHDSGLVGDRYMQWWQFITSGEHYAIGMKTIDLRTFVNRWGGSVTPGQFIPFQALAGLAVVAVVTRHARRFEVDGYPSPLSVGLAYRLSMLWLVTFGPATEEATFLLASPALAWILLRTADSPVGGWERGLTMVAWFVVGPCQTSIISEPGRVWVYDLKLVPVAMLFLFSLELARGWVSARRVYLPVEIGSRMDSRLAA